MRKQDAMLGLGSCPGVPQYKMDWEIPLATMATSPRPGRVQEGHRFIDAGSDIHPRHNIAWHRGVIICLQSGHYVADKVVRKLGDPCKVNQVSYYGKRNLAKFKAPIPSPSGSLEEWPMPEDASPESGR